MKLLPLPPKIVSTGEGARPFPFLLKRTRAIIDRTKTKDAPALHETAFSIMSLNSSASNDLIMPNFGVVIFYHPGILN